MFIKNIKGKYLSFDDYVILVDKKTGLNHGNGGFRINPDSRTVEFVLMVDYKKRKSKISKQAVNNQKRIFIIKPSCYLLRRYNFLVISPTLIEIGEAEFDKFMKKFN